MTFHNNPTPPLGGRDVPTPASMMALVADDERRAAPKGSDLRVPRSGLKSFDVLGLDAFLAMEFPPREILLSPWLPEKGLTMIYGPRGIGKTHMTLGCAFALASGAPFLRWHAPKPRRVVIIDGEMPAFSLQERLKRIAELADRQPPSGDYLRILPMDLQSHGFDLSNPDDQRAIEGHLQDADLIIVDNISTLVRGGRENEAESWLPVQEWALGHRRAGRSVIFIHHAGKGGAQRGTSRREDVLDTVIALRKPEDYQPGQGARFEVHFEKNRGFHGHDALPFEAMLGNDGWVTKDLTDTQTDHVLHHKANGLSVRQIAEVTGMSKSKVARMIARAAEQGPEVHSETD